MEYEQTNFCQSCGMPLSGEETYGTNGNGSKNNDYCIYCFKNGAFTVDCTMEEMIGISLDHMKEIFRNNPDFNGREALAKMISFFPALKRWRS